MEPAKEVAIRLEAVTKIYRAGQATFGTAGRALLGRVLGRSAHARPDEVVALRDVSLEIRRGECVGLIGRNGSGKSTMLKIISDVLRPTRGSVAVHGTVQSMLELGVGFNPDFTGQENLLIHGTLLGLSTREVMAHYEEICAFAEIGEFMERPVRQYSSGMVLRLAFASFVLMKPEILIIDEAMAVGDIFFQQRCYDFLRGPLADATKIIVSHAPDQLAAVCQRLLILDGGELDYDGPIGPGIERYLKSLHNEGARSGVRTVHEEGVPPAEIPWTTLPEDQLSGKGALRIVRAAVTDPAGHAVAARTPGERVVVHLVVRVLEPRAHLIFGYLLRDGTGQQVCGQNSLVLRDADGRPAEFDLPEPGDWHATLEFDWPALKPQAYTLTLGIGEGRDAHHHVVQCWAHDCFQILGQDPDKAIHGLFGSGLEAFRRRKL